MKHNYRMLGTIGIATIAFAISGMQIAQAEPVTLECSNLNDGFQISINNGQQSAPLLQVKDRTSIRQTCSQVAARLQQAIRTNGLENLLLVAHVIRRSAAICVVQSSDEGCRQNNLLLDVPKGQDRDKFLDEIIVSPTETFFSGSEGQHTNRRKYAKFGPASNRLTK